MPYRINPFTGSLGYSVDSTSFAASFQESRQTATLAQTVFSAGFEINKVYVDGMLFTTGYSGGGTNTITFDTGRSDGSEIYMTT